MKHLVPFSGGKDSQATLIWAVEKFGAHRVTAVFCDTKWEHPITYKHIQYVVDKLGVEFVNLVSKKYDGMVDLAKKKKRFPSTKSKFCTTELKVVPMIDYILSLQQTVIVYQGIRADESPSRSLMNKQCTYFKYYFQPYRTNTMIVEDLTASLEKNGKLTPLQRVKLEKAQARLAIGKEDPKFHTYRKKDVFAFCKLYGDDVQRPFFEATGNEVISYSLSRDIEINPLYFRGNSRVGCFPCIMCTQDEIDIIIKEFPDTVIKISEAEKEVGHTFFPPEKIPERYRSGKNADGKTFATWEDIVRYRRDVNATGDLFSSDDEHNRCKSVYSICE